MHEHLFVLSTEVTENWPESWGDDDERVQSAAAQLNELKASGYDTFVDCSVAGLGRNVERQRRVAELTNMNIIVATGLYTYRDLPFQLEGRGPGSTYGGPEFLDKLFIRDIEVGIAGSGVRAAILKCAIDEPGLTPGVERVLRTVARAQRETGVPITTHTHAAAEGGLEQQRVFAEEGVDLGDVIIGHSGDSDDLDYLMRLIDKGSYLGLDRFGFDVMLSHDRRIATLVALCERGLEERIVLSHDYSCHNEWLDHSYIAEHAPRWSFFHIERDVLPELRDRGVRERQIETMLVDNPRRIFTRARS